MICLVFDHDGMAGVLLDDHIRCPCNFIGLVRFQLFYFLSIPPHRTIECHQQLPSFEHRAAEPSLGPDFPNRPTDYEHQVSTFLTGLVVA